ncbi:lipid A 3-O-deacylase [Paraburkholderia sp. GAS199]|uniref:acyloxyacyl hydrolase n=1 Tax=Paraburkholderia sp. GAS199 TaxID=3035126 RepID=UPI003D1FF4EE
MTKKKSFLARSLASPAIVIAVTTWPGPSQASDFGIQLGAGVADHDVRKGDLGFVWDPGLSWWNIAGYHFALVGEAHAAYWEIDESRRAHSSIQEFGITPVFRFIRGYGWFRPYIEAGVGVRLLSHVRETTDRTLSSSFQFADMVGVGLQFGARQTYQVAFRFQHLSNAGIKHPNPGINFSEIYFQYNF